MQAHASRISFVFSLGLLLLISMGASLSHAAQWQVSAHGLDSNSCTSVAPCRSISEAIRRASAGDSIYVLPGVYGDLNENGVLGEPGEENGEVGYGCYCVVKVDKAVTIFSQGGALLTRIDVRGFAETGTLIFGVRVMADGAVFGLPQQGFQISGSGYFAARIDGSHVSFSGNVMSGSESGVQVTGSNNKLDNDLSINGAGAAFDISGSNNNVINSLASGGGAGFQVSPLGTTVPTGNTFTNDISTGNQVGFNLFGPAVISNVDAIGNWEAGIAVRTGGQATVSNSNIFGNGTQTALNCGIENYSGTTSAVTKSYWGTASGPGPEPADVVCNYNNSTTTVPSISSTAYSVSFKP